MKAYVVQSRIPIPTNRMEFATLKLRDLRQLERAMQIRIEMLSAFKVESHKDNAIFLTLAPDGIALKYKQDALQAEISHCEKLLYLIQIAILGK